MGAIDFHITVGAYDQNAGAVQIARKIEKQVERTAVSVVKVLEYHQERLMFSGTMQQVCCCLEQPPAILFGVAWWRRRDLESLAQHGNDPCQVGCAGA